jgi:hypothetical protein
MHPATSLPSSMSFALDVRGSVEPRLWTPPLRPLTPDTSYGYDVIEFAADVLRRPCDRWQCWSLIHGCELLPDGRPRFRTVLVLAARQNGKTEIPVVLAAYWQFVERVAIILGTSTKLDYAKETWRKTINLVERSPLLSTERPLKRWYREANDGQECWSLPHPETGVVSRYKIAASNSEGGRSLTVDRLVMDELRQHHDYSAYDAMVPAGNAVRDFQAWCMTNAGDDRSVVLNDLRDQALTEIKNGVTTSRLGIQEWSAPDDADPEDPYALAQANPSLGNRIQLDVLLDAARAAKAKGGKALTGFKTEIMCIRVKNLAPAIDPTCWRNSYMLGDLSAVRDRVALCLDLAPDLRHATLYAAAVVPDGKVRVEVVQAWDGDQCTAQLKRSLPRIVARVRPRILGWLPGGPAAALHATMAKRKGWPPAGVPLEEIRGETTAVCMGFAELVESGGLVHAADPLLDAHVDAAEPLRRGDGWIFSRKGEGHVDAVYAAAGAAHLARLLPAAVGKPRLVVVDD